MKKIPTVFVRDEETQRRFVKDEVTPGCEWVLAGEGTATRKYDGTCVMFDGIDWWARREIKQGKAIPEAFLPEEVDEVTGKTVGWEPADRSSFYKWLQEALDPWDGFEAGTYELCGPKINGNHEHFPEHRLISHDRAEVFNLPETLDFRTCERAVRDLAEFGHEGIVWHHPDGRTAKLKARDFSASKET